MIYFSILGWRKVDVIASGPNQIRAWRQSNIHNILKNNWYFLWLACYATQNKGFHRCTRISKKISVSVSILRLIPVSLSVSISRFEKKSLDLEILQKKVLISISELRLWRKSLRLSLVIETTRKKSRSWSRNWDWIEANLVSVSRV